MIVKLTKVIKQLTEEGERKKIEFINNIYNSPEKNDEPDWDAMGLIPSEEDIEITGDDYLIEGIDYIYDYDEYLLNIEHFVDASPMGDFTAVQSVTGRIEYVKETIKEIEKLIK